MRGEYVEADGARLYYYAAGTRQSGETLVFLHGLLTSAHLWQEVVSLLPRTHRSLVVDLMGHGRSDPGIAEVLSVAHHAQRVVALMDCLGMEQATLVGHGLGAGVALRVAQDYPRRTTRLGLVAPQDRAPPAWHSLRRLAEWRRLTTHLPPRVLRHLARRGLMAGYSGRVQAKSVHSVELYLRPYATQHGVATMLAQIDALSKARTGEALRLPLDVPVAITWGSEDALVSSEVVDQLHSAIARSTLERVEGGSHFLPEELPERIVAFLSTLLTR